MKTVGIFLLYLMLTSTSHALIMHDPATEIVQYQQYRLLDHPDSSLTASQGPYGLRLDSLLPAGNGPTFSTELGGANVVLEWAGTSATIWGTVYNNATGELWDVHQVMESISAISGGFQATAGYL